MILVPLESPFHALSKIIAVNGINKFQFFTRHRYYEYILALLPLYSEFTNAPPNSTVC